MAVVPQDIPLFHRSIYENIQCGNLDASDEEIKKAVKDAHADKFIDNLPNKYESVLGERGVKISVGQKQRVAIARSLLRDSPILIFDEATSALDNITEKHIHTTISNIVKDKNKTVLVIAHRLTTLKKLDRILFIENGKIIEEGDPNVLLNNKDGRYKKLWDSGIEER